MQKQLHKGWRGEEEGEVANNYLRHVQQQEQSRRRGRHGCMCVRMRLLASECETGINMWHPDDDQSAAADMTAKRRNGAPSGYASSVCEKEAVREGERGRERGEKSCCTELAGILKFMSRN